VKTGNREQGIGNRREQCRALTPTLSPRRGSRRGFTLVELLVAMAVSAILLFLVLGPVVKSLQMTRQAQAMVDAQDAARITLLTISRELGQAMFVYDNAQVPYAIDTSTVDAPPNASDIQTPIMLPVAVAGGGTRWFVLPYAKIDFILPKLYMHCNNPNHAGGPRDYPRSRVITSGGSSRTELYSWENCPYCGSSDVEARPKLPLEQDVTVVRYFLGLRNNRIGEPIDPPRIPVDNDGWVSPWGKNVITGTENGVVLYRVEFDPYDDTLFPAGFTIEQRLADPFFFYRRGTRDRWAAIARVMGVAKFEDLVKATYDSNDNVTAIEPTVTFRTASVENDTFVPAFSADIKSEYPDATPTVLSGSYGYWTPTYRVDVMRGNYCDDPPSGVDYYTTRLGNDDVIMRRVPGSGGTWDETVEFNISEYRRDGFVPPDSAGSGPREMAFTVDANRGTVNFALQPPRPRGAKSGPVSVFDAADVNADFHADYAIDPGGAVRRWWMPTFALAPGGSPMHPDQYLANARIVPGSEKIIGPDMTSGPHYGKPVRYNRVPLALGDPEANQYKIDYDTGWLYFSRDPSLDLPERDVDNNVCRIKVYYLIYFNKKDDVVRGDYLTKSLINVHIGMRMFDPDSGKPYPIDLSDSVKIRNAIR